MQKKRKKILFMKNNVKTSERDYFEDAKKIYEKIKNIVPRIETKEIRIDENEHKSIIIFDKKSDDNKKEGLP